MTTHNYPPHSGRLRVGDIVKSTTADPDPRWRPCEGQLARQSDEPELYAAIGTTFNRQEWVWDYYPWWMRFRWAPLRWKRRRKGHLEDVDPAGWFRYPDYESRILVADGKLTDTKVRWFIYVGDTLTSPDSA